MSKQLQPDPTLLRCSLLEVLKLEHSELTTEELRHQVEAEHGELSVISEGGNKYLYLEHDEILLMVPLRRGGSHG
jgi:hypothetical protein